MSVCVDQEESYIVYRFGTKNKIELEYPKERSGSWKRFRYSFYLRGGGPQNDGLDLNYLIFTNNNVVYTIYQEYDALSNTTTCGIRIENQENNIDISGDSETIIGTLADFRNNTRIQKGE
jgi:hypothetical protein